MSRLVHVQGYAWRDGVPVLRFLERQRSSELRLTGSIRWLVTDTRRCLGTVERGQRRPCPTEATPDRSGHCRVCAWADGFRACMVCTGFSCPSLPPAMQEQCQSRHVLYLACFGDQRIKVGTAVWRRRLGRLHDQGPLAALHVASSPGPVIKQMENLLVKAGFHEAFRREEKRRLLASPMSESGALEQLEQAASRLPELLPARYHEALITPRPVPLPEKSRQARGRSYDLLATAPGHLLSGEVVQAVGHLIAVRDDAGTFFIDLGELKARVVDLDPPLGAGRKSTVQLSLF